MVCALARMVNALLGILPHHRFNFPPSTIEEQLFPSKKTSICGALSLTGYEGDGIYGGDAESPLANAAWLSLGPGKHASFRSYGICSGS